MMADMAQLERALVNADAAGDVEAAKVLANEIRRVRTLNAAVPPAPSKGVGAQLDDMLGQIPRLLGLTARAGIEGVGDTADMLAAPFRLGLNAVLPNLSNGNPAITGRTGAALANLIGLPTPETQMERIGSEGAKTLAGGGALLKGAQLASQLPGLAGQVGTALAANPAQQMQAAAGAGTAGGLVKETGGSPTAQFVAALGGGIGAPLAVNAVKGIPNAARSAVEFLAPGTTTPKTLPEVDVILSNVLQSEGLTVKDVSASVLSQLRQDIGAALKTGGKLDDGALQRLAAYRMVGATPRRGNLTLNPADLTQEKNLAKFGVNSADPKLQQLAQIQNENVGTLIERLNSLGASTADDALAGGQKVMGRLSSLNDANKAAINLAYEQARNTAGRSANLDPSAFTQRANNLLDDALLGGKLPTDVRNLLNRTAQGEMPLTVDVAEQFKTRIGDLQRATTDMAERKALGLVRQALDDTPLLGNQGQSAIDAFNKARGLNRQWMNVVDQVPALQAVRDGMEPDKFVQQFIIGNGSKASVNDVAKLRSLIKDDPQAVQAVREQMMAFVKNRALGGKPDEARTLSSTQLIKALDAIGERKAAMFFTKDELAQIKAIAKVAMAEQVQPAGSAVNNSNTAAAGLAAIFDKIANSPIVGKIPLGTQIAGNIRASLSARNALNTPQALLMPSQSGNSVAPFLLPAAAAGGGLLSSP